MAGASTKRALDRVAALRRLPIAKLMISAEIALLAHEHLMKLEPGERRRLAVLVRRTHGRARNLSMHERDELAALVAKMEPRAFVSSAAARVAPLPLSDRVLRARRRRS